jgi:LemA protein
MLCARPRSRAKVGVHPLTKNTSVVVRRLTAAFLVLLVSLSAAGCGYNDVISKDEDVKGAWAEVQNQYKRRTDLVPNLVQTVKASAAFETDTLQKVVEARSKVSQIKVDASTIDDPAKLKAFEQAQGQLSGALSRLMVVAEKYPELKSTEGFRDLQSQLEGTENRIAVARNRYIAAVADYNKTVQLFPSSIGASLRHKTVRPTFEGEAGGEKPPEVKF